MTTPVLFLRKGATIKRLLSIPNSDDELVLNAEYDVRFKIKRLIRNEDIYVASTIVNENYEGASITKLGVYQQIETGSIDTSYNCNFEMDLTGSAINAINAVPSGLYRGVIEVIDAGVTEIFPPANSPDKNFHVRVLG